MRSTLWSTLLVMSLFPTTLHAAPADARPEPPPSAASLPPSSAPSDAAPAHPEDTAKAAAPGKAAKKGKKVVKPGADRGMEVEPVDFKPTPASK